MSAFAGICAHYARFHGRSAPRSHFVPTRSVVQVRKNGRQPRLQTTASRRLRCAPAKIRTHAQKYFLRVAKEQGIDPKQVSTPAAALAADVSEIECCRGLLHRSRWGRTPSYPAAGP